MFNVIYASLRAQEHERGVKWRYCSMNGFDAIVIAFGWLVGVFLYVWTRKHGRP